MAAHVEDRLVPFLSGDLSVAESAAVQAHFETCAGCRAALEDFRRIADDLARWAPEPPPVHWGAYRADLRERLERRSSGRPQGWEWGMTPLRGVLAAGLIAILIYLGGPGPVGPPRSTAIDQTALDEVILTGQLELIARLDLVQRLELLEDLDVIGRLDRLPRRSDS